MPNKKRLKIDKATRKTPDVTSSSPNESPVSLSPFFLFGVFICISATYVLTTYPSIPGGDTGELVSAACEFGVAHPPGYPLWTLMSIIWMSMLPLSPAYSVNLLTCLISAASSGLVLMLCYRLTNNITGSLISTVFFSLSPLVWTWSITGEVFALNNFLCISLLYTLTNFELATSRNDRAKYVYLGSFLSGLALSNQHTSVLFIVVMVIRVVYKLWKLQEITIRTSLLVVVLGLTGLIPYVYLPISSYANKARWSWGEHTTLNGFFSHFLRVEYGSFDLGKGGQGQGLATNLVSYKANLLSELSIPGYFLACLGIVQTFIDQREDVRRTMETNLSMLVVYVMFFCWRANLDISSPLLKGVIERFWLQPLIIWIVLVAFGYKLLHIRLELRTSVPVAVKAGVVTIVLAFCLGRGIQVCNHRNDTIVSDFADAVINSLPKDAIVLTKGDLPSGVLRYKQFCEGRRPDLTLIEQELMSYNWFVPKMKSNLPGVVFPGDRWYPKTGKTVDGFDLFNMKMLLDSNMKLNKSIFVCIGMQEKENSWQDSFSLMPYGVCHQVVRSSDDWVELVQPYKDTWSTKYVRLDPSTWEHVANEEMWSAKIAKPLAIWKEADASKDVITQATHYRQSYKDYKAVMDSHEDVPAFFHKNFALSCERMARVPQHGGEERRGYLLEAIKHFETFLELDGGADPQTSAIRQAVKDFKVYVE